ncbi:annexin B9-like isoform X1 [Neocloeon triangulifer]|uniref:annexin B9-like isoform X1 n=1 Tax=Neocloeon triangulifer TaxID=2078957 RepID=UPI00286F1882|nr:annexin B9-like isoform X1 [Neocloeon triangulifer]
MPHHRYATQNCVPTVLEYKGFDPNSDAAALEAAMCGQGTNEDAIIDILAHRTVSQRLKIAEVYKELYDTDLVGRLKKDLTGHMENVTVAMMTPISQLYAVELRKAVSGLLTDEESLVEVLMSLSNFGVIDVATEYENMYGRSLEHDLKNDSSGEFRNLLVRLCSASRDESDVVNEEIVRDDALALAAAEVFWPQGLHGENLSCSSNRPAAGASEWATEESVFASVLASRSFAHLRLMFRVFRSVTGRDIEAVIDQHFSGKLRKGFLSIVRIVRKRPAYFARRLYESMKGLGTDDHTLIRIVVSRSEIDLGDIKQEYLAQYGQTLEKWIEGDTLGHYRRMLLALVSY